MKKHQLYPLLIIIAAAIIGFFNIGFFIHPLNFDMIDCALPWRHIVSESIRNGYLPSWNAYQNLGYPLPADPTAGSWYPVIWFFSLFGKYTATSLHIEVMLHIILAGFGMFLFLKTLNIKTVPALIGAISYQLSGFFVNSQCFYLLISATWLPYIFAYYYKLYNERSLKNSILFSIFVYLSFTGGYTGLLFINAYILAAIFFFNIVQIIRKKSNYDFLKYNIISLLLIIILSAPQWASALQSLPYINRADGVTLRQALYGPFSIESLMSFVAPFSTVKNPEFLNTDISMANGYFGIIVFLFFILGFLQKSNRFFNFIKISTILCLLASLGSYTPFREFLYNYVPLMNMFRFPSIFRLFAIFGMIVISINQINIYIENGKLFRNKNAIILSSLGILSFLIVIVYSRMQGNLNILHILKYEIFTHSTFSNNIQHFAFQSIFQIGLLITLIVVLIKPFKNHKIIGYSLIIITILDLGFSSNLNAPYTVCSTNVNFCDTKKADKFMVKGYNNDHSYSVEEMSNGKSVIDFTPYWRNRSNFTKQVSNDGYTSLFLKNYLLMTDSFPEIIQATLKNKIFYSPNLILKEDQIRDAIKDSLDLSKTVFYNKDISVDTSNKNTFTDIKINPISISTNANIVNNGLVVLQQNYYPYWRAYIDGKDAPILIVNKFLMGLEVPIGNHVILFKYENPIIKWLFFISSATFLLMLVAVFFLKEKF